MEQKGFQELGVKRPYPRIGLAQAEKLEKQNTKLLIS